MPKRDKTVKTPVDVESCTIMSFHITEVKSRFVAQVTWQDAAGDDVTTEGCTLEGAHYIRLTTNPDFIAGLQAITDAVQAKAVDDEDDEEEKEEKEEKVK